MGGTESGDRALENVIVVPRNGYINRIQAWASAAILAAELDVPLNLAWEPQPVAPAALDDLFAASGPGVTLLTPAALRARLGRDHAELDRYLSVDAARRVVTLAGHDRGEQVFMAELEEALGHPCGPTTLLLIAGGKFHLPEVTDFERQRHRFYQRLPWSSAVTAATELSLSGRDEFIGLHVRETDRSVTAPTTQAMRSAVMTLAERTGVGSVFLAADTAEARQRWLDELRGLGLAPWAAPDPHLDRSRASAGLDAMADWRILSACRALVYSRESSFGEEAAVAGNSTHLSIPLSASPARQRSRRAATLGRSVLAYPERRWGQGRKPS